MQFTIAYESRVPPFEQLCVQVRENVRGGTLTAGERLPTVRALAETLGLASNTVARAYRELESDGLIETRGRNGSFVSPHGDANRRQAQLAAHVYATRLHQLGIDPGEGLDLARAALHP